MVTDAQNTQMPGVVVRALRDGAVVAETFTDSSGWFMLSNVPSGPVSIEASLAGFRTGQVNLTFDAVNARRVDFQLPVAVVGETVEVEASASDALRPARPLPPSPAASPEKAREEYAQAPSSNVFNLQRRVAGVLPVRVDVPRAGAAYKFVRPLVLDETTRVSFEYRPR